MALKTNYKEDVLATSNAKRKYNMITNDDGTVSFEDVTNYDQIGDNFGAADINSTNMAITNNNEAIDALNLKIDEKESDYRILGVSYLAQAVFGSTFSEKTYTATVPSGTAQLIPFFYFISAKNASFQIVGPYVTTEGEKFKINISGQNVTLGVGYWCLNKTRS